MSGSWTAVPEDGFALIGKPFTRQKLLAMVEGLLEACDFEEIERENQRLRSYLVVTKQFPVWRPKLARVIGREPANWWRNINREWIVAPKYRCLVPFTAFAEPVRDSTWFAVPGVDVAYFAGFWRPWEGERLAEQPGLVSQPPCQPTGNGRNRERNFQGQSHGPHRAGARPPPASRKARPTVPPIIAMSNDSKSTKSRTNRSE
jgi:hypothetical protein